VAIVGWSSPAGGGVAEWGFAPEAKATYTQGEDII